jgi:hypothetical protein
MPHVRVLRPFNNGSHHAFARPGDVLTVGDDRAADLMRNGLVETFEPEKAAPVPDNKLRQPPVIKPGRKPLGRSMKAR